ncbi:MAG: hypothetical protein ACRDLE_05185 [Gaiellaceae bacterium]
MLLRAAAGGLGLVCLVAGTVFFFQGIGVIGGSSMSGSTTWAVIGPILVAVGIGFLVVARR